MDIQNEKMADYPFLSDMVSDPYFPPALVEKGQAILQDLCRTLEASPPENLDELYALTHAATDRFNDLQAEFEDNDSEIETAAREAIANDFAFIAQAYGFEEAEVEDLIATRDW